MSDDTTSHQLTLFSEVGPAKTSPSPASEPDWREREAASSGKRRESWRNCDLLLSCSKTSPAFYPVTLDEISERSSSRFENSGRVTSRGELLTLNTPEYHSDGVESSLSQILEANAPRKYFLSPKAAAGILRRAEKRGRELPPLLLEALQAVAESVQRDAGKKMT